MIKYPDTSAIAQIEHGAWIDDRADIHLLANRLEHNRFCDYGDAHKCGWIGVVMFKSDPRRPEEQRIGFRLNPRTATVAALISAVCVVEQFPDAVYSIENAFAERMPLPDGCRRVTEYKGADVKRYLNDLRFWKQEMSSAMHPCKRDFPTCYPKDKK